MIGDLGELDDLDSEVNSKQLLYIFFLLSTIILFITMLNLLISIISETFGEVKKAEKRTKIWEKWNIITEIDVMLSLKNQIPPPNQSYLMYIYNERHEKEFVEIEEEQHKVSHFYKIMAKKER